MGDLRNSEIDLEEILQRVVILSFVLLGTGYPPGRQSYYLAISVTSMFPEGRVVVLVIV